MLYKEKTENVLKRDFYIQKMLHPDVMEKCCIMYMDKSYIHQHYSQHDESLYDPDDKEDLDPKQSHKGRCYCFIAAILSADLRSKEGQCLDSQEAQLMRETLEIFEGSKKMGGKAQMKDYHGMFDHAYFVQWMKKLLLALKNRNITNALIIMDNAKYQKFHGKRISMQNWNKQHLIDFCK